MVHTVLAWECVSGSMARVSGPNQHAAPPKAVRRGGTAGCVHPKTDHSVRVTIGSRLFISLETGAVGPFFARPSARNVQALGGRENSHAPSRSPGHLLCWAAVIGGG